MNSESNHGVIKVSLAGENTGRGVRNAEGEKTIEGRKGKQDREKMKWVLFRLQAEKEQYEEK